MPQFDSASFFANILASLSDRISVLDATGRILYTNAAWKQFARENGDPLLTATCEGVNYLETCRTSTGDGGSDARRTYSGIREVLETVSDYFEMEYPCHSPHQKRWFLLRVTPLEDGEGKRGAVVEHSDITARRLQQQAQSDALHTAEERARRLSEDLSLSRVSQQSAVSPQNISLRESSPAENEKAILRYRKLLEAALESRAYKTERDENSVRRFGEHLGSLLCTPRDVIEIHLAAMTSENSRPTPQRSKACTEEGRMLLIELLGFLALAYRQIATRTEESSLSPLSRSEPTL